MGVTVGGSGLQGWQWLAVAGRWWQGWRVRLPVSEVTFDFSFTLWFIFGFLVAIYFTSVFSPLLCFSFPSLSFRFFSSHESYFYMFICSEFIAPA
jgi:hypothetical protein